MPKPSHRTFEVLLVFVITMYLDFCLAHS